MIAYVSRQGLDAIGISRLATVLQHRDSFGVASLSCSCGFEPLLRLQGQISQVRLKYFLDPMVEKPDEPTEIVLFHSKIVYLVLDDNRTAVVYVGSHNWSGSALGPTRPRNAEASLRIEFEHNPDYMTGVGSSFGAEVNQHLLNAWNSPLCLAAIPSNRPTFEQWYAKGCQKAPSAPLQGTTIVLAVHKGGQTASDNEWLQLQGRGIYFQVLEEDDGAAVWRCDDKLLILVWGSHGSLQAAHQPVILQCRVTTYYAGFGATLRGTNQSDSPVEGFEAVLIQAASGGPKQMTRIWSGVLVQTYAFEFPALNSTSELVDGGVSPRYRYHLEVERVVLPASPERSPEAQFLWTPKSFAVAQSKASAKLRETPGYYVEPEMQRTMLHALEKEFGVSPSNAKVLPFSEKDPQVGKRLSHHDLHDTFIGKSAASHESNFEAPAGFLVAHAPEPRSYDAREPMTERIGSNPRDEYVPAVQKLFTMPFENLFEVWSALAEKWRRDWHTPE